RSSDRLENIRLRLRRNSASDADRKKFDTLQNEVDRFKRLIGEFEDQIEALKEEKITKKAASDQYQEKLIREGTSLSVDDLNELRNQQKELSLEYDVIKARMKDLLELAPFAIAWNKFNDVRKQLLAEIELEQSDVNPVLI